MVELLRARGLPAVLLPGVVHLDTVPAHRKVNRVDMGTADKLCVAALGVRDQGRRLGLPPEETAFVLLELGGFFTAALAVEHGRIVDGIGGSAGGLGYRALGALDGEVAYALGRVKKSTLFTGGAAFVAGAPDLPPEELRPRRARAAGATRLGGPDRGGREAGRSAARRRAGRPRGAALRARRPPAGGRRGPRRAARRRVTRSAARRLHHAREGSGPGRGADRRRPRRRAAPRRGRHDAPPREPRLRAGPPLHGRRGRGATRTSGSRANPDRRPHDAAPSPSRPCAPERRSSPSTTSATSTRRASARRIPCGSAGAGTRPPRSSRRRASSRTRPSCTAGASRTIRTWSPSWPATACCSATTPARSAGYGTRASSSRFSRGAGSPCPTRAASPIPCPWPAAGSQAGARGRRPGRAHLDGPAARADADPPGARRRGERLGRVRGRRPPERGPRLDRTAPRPAELPLRRQRHAARGPARGARGSRRDRRRAYPGVRAPGSERLRLHPARRSPRGAGGEPALLRLHGAGGARVRGVGVRPSPGRLPGTAPRARRRAGRASGARRSSTPRGPWRSRTRPRGSRQGIRDVPHPGRGDPRRAPDLHGARLGRRPAQAARPRFTRRPRGSGPRAPRSTTRIRPRIRRPTSSAGGAAGRWRGRSGGPGPEVRMRLATLGSRPRPCGATGPSASAARAGRARTSIR